MQPIWWPRAETPGYIRGNRLELPEAVGHGLESGGKATEANRGRQKVGK
jgi:hypothetical protein